MEPAGPASPEFQVWVAGRRWEEHLLPASLSPPGAPVLLCQQQVLTGELQATSRWQQPLQAEGATC